jgi:fructosamine-3-kinase
MELPPSIPERFATDHIFHPIRLEPYLVATAHEHPEVSPQLLQLVEVTASTKRALVHGDVSPKNILVGPDGPVFLDAECAWFGDPAFDMRIRVTALADVALKAFPVFAQVVPDAGQCRPRRGAEPGSEAGPTGPSPEQDDPS